MIFVKLPASCRDRIRHCDNPADRTNNSLSLLFTSFKAASESLHDNLSWKLFQYRNTVKSKPQYNSSPAYCLSFTLHTLRPFQLGNITNIFPCRIRQCIFTNSQSCSDSRAFDCLPIPISSVCN